ncbi:hypothetical protein RJ639_042298 [Escallonia herrerae]|uniref:CCHC-type domain-containing protein n=1 Tax=Escallonia herrerae TaxID=1293975 RepID=A0AA88WFL8_9ASTE|nr:hypothetical protein RJ639_042298 [Escallonia herrerae]
MARLMTHGSGRPETVPVTTAVVRAHWQNFVGLEGRILSALSDRLYDVYHATKSAKELWNLLQGEYGIDDAGIERFNASTFNKFVTVEGKEISDQIHEFQDHLRAVEENGSKFSEDYKVSCLIDKLPPSWSDFAKGLRHKQGTLTLTQAFNSLRIEEKHRESIKHKEVTSNQANLVKNNITSNTPHHLRPRGNNFRNNNRRNTQGNNNFHRINSRHNNFLVNRFPQNNNNQPANLPNHKNAKDAKGKGKRRPCYVCRRTNHIARDCFYKRVEKYKPNGRNQGDQVNMLMQHRRDPITPLKKLHSVRARNLISV